MALRYLELLRRDLWDFRSISPGTSVGTCGTLPKSRAARNR